jgi:hypothetical protein
MKEKSYSCNTCKERFGRRWNADRHNSTVHSDMAIIFNNKTGSISKHKETTQRYDNPRNIYQKSPSYKRFKEMKNNFSPFRKDDLEMEEELKIISIFGKLKQPFEDLEKLLSDNPENIKIKLLSDMVIYSLTSSNPVKSLQEEIELCQSLSSRQKIIECVSKGNSLTPGQTYAYLNGLIKNGRYYKRK